MSRKIIGVTVGTQLPKPNFKQNDPTKGDYIKNKPDFDGLKNEVLTVRDALEQKQPIGDYALNSDVDQAKQEVINISNAYTDEQIESVLIYVDKVDIEALF
jgi:hypothetical protein